MGTKTEILERIEKEGVEFVRLQFTDMIGNLKNVAVTPSKLKRLSERRFPISGQLAFGEYGETEDDFYLKPDFDSFVILPWRPQNGKVARLICDIYDANGNIYGMSPRAILQRVVSSAAEAGYTFRVDPECEFFLFHIDDNGVPTAVTHERAGYMDVGPLDLGENARREMVFALEEMGFEVESSHHECAPGQQEIDFAEAEPMYMADSMVTFKSAVKSIARKFGLHATFMPKPRQGEAGSGMHLNISVYKDGRNIFNSEGDDAARSGHGTNFEGTDPGDVRFKADGDGQANDGITKETKYFMGGVMSHVKAMCAVTNPLVNSYKRIVSGFEAPNRITWEKSHERAALKVRKILGEDTKVELRFPDPSANPYLALAVCIAAGMDGLTRHLDPGPAGESMGSFPGTLTEAVGFMKGDPFMRKTLGDKFVDAYSDVKMREWNDYMGQVSDWEINRYLNRV